MAAVKAAFTASNPLRLAVVGCGQVAGFHCAGIQQAKLPISITTVVDPNRTRASQLAHGSTAQYFRRFEDAIAGAQNNFDAVLCAVPHDKHENIANQALMAQKHLLLEKPMAPTVESCERVLSAWSSRPDLVFMVAENSQYWPEVNKTSELLDAGLIGDVVTAHAIYYEALGSIMDEADTDSPCGHSDSSDADVGVNVQAPSVDLKLGWRASLAQAGGGVVIDGGQHWIRPLRLWLGEIDSVIGVTERTIDAMEGETLAHALFKFRNGKTAVFQAMVLAPPALMAHNTCPWFRVTGTKGEVLVGGTADGGVFLYNNDHPRGKSMIEKGQPTGFLASFGRQMKAFLHAVQSGAAPKASEPASASFSVGEVRTATALYRSVLSGTWERVW